ncbi:MAG: LysR family transcriptional regulator, partial [Parvibaculum sp.]|uniref:LysR substrate-binding domain-containing protein n=1 Tax=Parvibaculum sp. TaxID=2024848 RepID=UPI001B13F500
FMLYTLHARPNQLEMTNAKGEKEQVELKGRFLCNNADAMVGMMLKGMGLVFSPDVLCHEHLKSGRLVRVLEDWSVPPLTLHAIYPHSRHLAAKVRAFVDFTVEKFGPGKAPWVG